MGSFRRFVDILFRHVHQCFADFDTYQQPFPVSFPAILRKHKRLAFVGWVSFLLYSIMGKCPARPLLYNGIQRIYPCFARSKRRTYPHNYSRGNREEQGGRPPGACGRPSFTPQLTFCYTIMPFQRVLSCQEPVSVGSAGLSTFTPARSPNFRATNANITSPEKQIRIDHALTCPGRIPTLSIQGIAATRSVDFHITTSAV